MEICKSCDGKDGSVMKSNASPKMQPADQQMNTENANSPSIQTDANSQHQVPYLSIHNLNKSFGKKQIIHNLSLDLYPGEILGFLGANGAGKTTVLKMILGFLTPDSGEILVHGQPIKKHFEASMSKIGGVVENPEMYKDLSAYQNLKMYARLHKHVDNARIQSVVESVRLEGRIHDKVKRYSLGMKQRLGLAQAILHDPDILLLDEPTNGLDPAGMHELRQILMHRAHEENKAILVSSHILSEMQMMCDRVAIIKEGHLVAVEKVQNDTDQQNVQLSLDITPIERAIELLKPYHEDLTVKNNQLTFKIHKDHIPELIRYLSNSGCNLFEVHKDRSSLESRFLEITGGGQTIA